MSHQDAARIYADADRMLPRVLIRAVLALIAASLAIVIYARATDRPLESTPPVAPLTAEVELILQSDGVSGAVAILRPDGRLVANLPPEDGGFIAGVHRVILRERDKHRVAADGPVRLHAYENGRMAIHDPSTGWSADLMGFGAKNASAFAHLLAQTQEGNTHGTAD